MLSLILTALRRRQPVPGPLRPGAPARAVAAGVLALACGALGVAPVPGFAQAGENASLRAKGPSEADRVARQLAERFPTAQRAAMRKALVQSLESYRAIEARQRWPSRDVPGAIAMFLVGNYAMLNGVAVSEEHLGAVARQVRANARMMATLRGHTPKALMALYEQQAMMGTFMALAQTSHAQQPLPDDRLQVLREQAMNNLKTATGLDPTALRVGADGMSSGPPTAAGAAAANAGMAQEAGSGRGVAGQGATASNGGTASNGTTGTTASTGATGATGAVGLTGAGTAAVAGTAGPAPARKPGSALTARPPLQGRLLLATLGGANIQLVDLRSGKAQELPASALRSRGADYWYTSQSGGTAPLVRKDHLGSLVAFDRRNLKPIGGIDLQPFLRAGTMPKFMFAARVSPDGRHLLGYWKPDETQRRSRLYVMTLAGKLVDDGSPLSYDNEGLLQAIDWLPDGRYVYLAGDRLVVARPGGGIVSQSPLRLPPDVQLGGAELRASPDGQTVLLRLTQRGAERPTAGLFTVRLDGSDLRQVVRVAPRALAQGSTAAPVGFSWSPDGQWVAFFMVGPGAHGAVGFQEVCAPVLAVPVSGGQSWDVDPQQDAAVLGLKPAGASQPLQGCKLNELSWLP